jgi:competence protein ComEC
MAFFLLALGLFNAKKISFQWSYSWVRGLLLEALVGILGVLVGDFQSYQTQFENQSDFHKKGNLFAVVFLRAPAKIGNLLVGESNFISEIRKDTIVKASGSILITIKIAENQFSDKIPRRGDTILFAGPLNDIKYPRNGFSVIHQSYSAGQLSKFRVFLKSGDYSIIRADSSASSDSMLELAQDKILVTLKKYITGDREAGLAEALLVGYRQDLDKDLLRSYTNTGVIHIIAISGLHLALIFGILKFLMKPLSQNQPGKWIASLITIGALWIFSFLSGSSPSVIRSAVMFTMVVIGENFRKRGSVYNSLFASAFILLFFNPSRIWDLGFQLSYLAVLSIVIFYLPIYHLIHVPWKIPDLIWKSIALTLAAQILTTPVCIFNFHQFPSYFLPANLLAVPLSSLILVGELLLCSITFLPEIAHLLGCILTKLIWILNSYIDCVSRLPFSTWNHLEISLFQTLLMYSAIWGLASWMIKFIKTGIFISLVSGCFWLIIRGLSFLNSFHQEILVVYNIPRRQAVDCIRGRQFMYFGDYRLVEDISVKKFYLDPLRSRFRLNKECLANTSGLGGRIFAWSKKKLLILEDSIPSNRDTSIHFDLILLSKNCPASVIELNRIFGKVILIFDRSNSWKKLIQWKKDCDRLGLPYYDLAEKGAFVMNMD